jgi:transaldolase / glucose-6-phosphate isomerase
MGIDVKEAGSLGYSLGKFEAPVKAQIEQFEKNQAVSKVWKHDASLWTGADEAQWLGWLDVVQQQLNQAAMFKTLSEEVKKAGFTYALLLGMGGSSLCVEVLRLTFGIKPGYPDMHVLDSTVPAQVLHTRKHLDLAKTLVIVASKSGGTTEPNVLMQYFYDETKKVLGEKVGDHFVAITDPGSSMEKRAQELKFRHIFHGVPSIGGRFSALSNFGMIPSAVMGYDVAAFLQHAQNMVDACSASVPLKQNPGALLGTIMGALANLPNNGCDKVTVITSPGIASFGAWLEQLMAESTGKEGKGLIPVSGEKLEKPEAYSDDRLFVYLRLARGADSGQDAAVQALEKAGKPVVRIEMAGIEELGGEFFRWEFATAIAGAALGINAFNQPNVQESKDYTKKFLGEYDQTGKLPEDELLFEEDGIKLFVDSANKAELEKAVGNSKGLNAFIAAHLKRIKTGDYFAINAYVDRDDQNQKNLEQLRTRVLERSHVATTLGFGPRFLHSTGQLHKGGPNSGVFLQITSDDKQDVAIPGEKYTFGVLKNAQSLGDFLALSKRQRRVLRVHLSADVTAGLQRLDKTFQAAL